MVPSSDHIANSTPRREEKLDEDRICSVEMLKDGIDNRERVFEEIDRRWIVQLIEVLKNRFGCMMLHQKYGKPIWRVVLKISKKEK